VLSLPPSLFFLFTSFLLVLYASASAFESNPLCFYLPPLIAHHNKACRMDQSESNWRVCVFLQCLRGRNIDRRFLQHSLLGFDLNLWHNSSLEHKWRYFWWNPRAFWSLQTATPLFPQMTTFKMKKDIVKIFHVTRIVFVHKNKQK